MVKTSQPAFFVTEKEILLQKFLEDKAKAKGKGSKKPRVSKPSQPKVFDCETCGLRKNCETPDMQRYGKGMKDILIVGMCPGKEEDESGRPFVGPSGRLLKKALGVLGVDLDKDCVRTNIVRCRPKGRNSPTAVEIKCCYNKLKKDIEEVRPKLILALGKESIETVLAPHSLGKVTLASVHGMVFANQTHNCWVGCAYHPSYVVREGGYKNERGRYQIFVYDLEDILDKINEPLPRPLSTEGNYLISSSAEAIELLNRFVEENSPTAFDYETNCLDPLDESAKIVTVALANSVKEGYCIWMANPEWNELEDAHVYGALRKFLNSSVPKVVQNYFMEDLWSKVVVGCRPRNIVHDTMLCEHILTSRGKTSLGYQVFRETGHDYKSMVDHETISDEPISKISDYNCWDARYTLMLYESQLPKLKGGLKRFNVLYHRCIKTLSVMKDRGIRIDVDLLKRWNKEWVDKADGLLDRILSSKVSKRFKKKYGGELNINSSSQLGNLLYSMYGIEPLKKTKGGKGATDEDTLGRIRESCDNDEIIEFLTDLSSYKKCFSFLKRVKEYLRIVSPSGYIHPQLGLHIASTFRSSSRNPNIQNVFKHDLELQMFRRCIIPSPGRIFLEVDYDGLEVKVIAMSSNDRILIEQIKQGVDFHRMWAAILYEKEEENVDKDQRYNSKNGFVFPSFYGSKPPAISRALGLSEEFVEIVQDEFWTMYADVYKWQESTLALYEETGYVEGLSGFRRCGPLTDEQIFNSPIQGTAFHLLLDGLDRIERTFRKCKLKSNPVFEVHDSIVFDAVPEEIEDVIGISTETLCSKRFDWQRDVPITVSWEEGPNWYDMKEINELQQIS